MVRAHMKQPSEETKEAHKKKISAVKRKSQETNAWLCKINGCNKEFAREADLKRHQRTTKMHSLPGVAVSCPQCDSSFSRTDALRRHQKSRHNGIVIEPVEVGQINEDGHAREQSCNDMILRSKTDSAILENTNSQSSAIFTRSETAGPATGAQSYYRPHTLASDLSSFQTGTQLPTSATRWVPATNWDATPQHLPPPVYPVLPQATSYYRNVYYKNEDGRPILTPGTIPEQTEDIPDSSDRDLQTKPSLHDAGSENTGIHNNVPAHVQNITDADAASINAAVQKALQAVLAIDPSLNSAITNNDQNHFITTEPVVNPVISRQPVYSPLNGNFMQLNTMPGDSTTSSPLSESMSNHANDNPARVEVQMGMSTNYMSHGNALMLQDDAEMDADADGEADLEEDGYVINGGSIEAYEMHPHMLSDESVPMLQPDELLIEESLVSPPTA